jgi:hypothetical protein
MMFLVALMAAPASAQDVGGFGGPLFGLATAPNGDLLVADYGVGIIPIRQGEVGSTIALPGITDVSPIDNDSLWAVTGAGPNLPDATADTGQALHMISNGNSTMVANLFQFEKDNDPDGGLDDQGNPRPDSNPFDVESLGGNAALVVDAGGNNLLRIDNQGNVTVLAIFPNELVSTANIKQLAGCPNPPPLAAFACAFPDFIPAQPVPTSVAVGPGGDIYVGELKGIPAPTRESNIWRVSPNANSAECGASADCVKVFDGGFTSIIDLAFGPDGQLYVAELDEASWAAVEIFQTPTGGSINACDVNSATCNEVASGISELTAISFGSLSFGNVAQAGLSEQFLRNDLTVVGSLAGGGALGSVDLIYVPEPSALVLALLSALGAVT